MGRRPRARTRHMAVAAAWRQPRGSAFPMGGGVVTWWIFLRPTEQRLRKTNRAQRVAGTPAPGERDRTREKYGRAPFVRDPGQ